MPARRELSLFDSTCIVVGIIVGAGIYETAPTVAWGMGSTAGVIGVWLVGGLFALAGALCYAELATAYPHRGGDYVYLNRAYGGWAGFLFGWSQLAIIRPGDIALMAFVFARYAQSIYQPFPHANIVYAALAVLLITLINLAGLRAGKWTQNVLTVAKIVGLLSIVLAGLLAPAPGAEAAATGSEGPTLDGVKLALILVMFTFGGWNEMAYVSAEVKRPERNIVRALVLGTAAVTACYVLLNIAYLSALGLGAQETIDPRTGRLFMAETDLVLGAGPVNLEVRRWLEQEESEGGLLGTRWRMNWEARLRRGDNVVLIQEDGTIIRFDSEAGEGRYKSVSGERVVFDLRSTSRGWEAAGVVVLGKLDGLVAD